MPLPGRRFEIFVLSAAAFLTVYIAITTLVAIHAAYLPLPITDSWDHWRMVASYGGNYLPFLFQQHNEHRIAVPRLFFLADQVWLHGTGVFVLTANLTILVIMALLLWRLALRAGKWSLGAPAMLGCLLLSAAFSGQQFSNLTSPFQIPFALVYCAAVGCVFTLERAPSRWLWIVPACLLGAVATYSMANGVLLWPVLLAMSFWLPVPRRARAVLAGCGAALTAAYLNGYHSPGHHAQPAAALTGHFGECVLFAAAYLGSPAEALLGALRVRSESILIAGCIAAGLAGMVAAGAALLLLLRQPKRNGTQAALLCLALFLAATAGVVALGRVNFPLSVALESRYRTPALLFWTTLAGFYWALFGARRPRWWMMGALLWIAVTAAPQRTWILFARDYVHPYREAEAAIASGVFDEPALSRVFHTPRLLLEPVSYLRRHHLALFAEEWTRWPGRPLTAVFPRTGTGCSGQIEAAGPVGAGVQPGYRLSGWAVDTPSGRAPETLVLTGEDGRILGVARTVTGRAWTGYVAGLEPRRITVWLGENSVSSACRIGTAVLGRN